MRPFYKRCVTAIDVSLTEASNALATHMIVRHGSVRLLGWPSRQVIVVVVVVCACCRHSLCVLFTGELPTEYYLMGDEAYRCTNQLLTPFPGRRLSRVKDAFNFWQSRLRINIECSFGLLVQRWGILWRPLRMKLNRVGKLILCLLSLNNIATRAGLDAREMCRKTAAYARKCDAAPYLELNRRIIHGRRRDLERSTRRIQVMNALDSAGLVRPVRSRWGLNCLETELL